MTKKKPEKKVKKTNWFIEDWLKHPSCKLCGDTGKVYVQEIVYYEEGRPTVLNEYLKDCWICI